MTHITVSWLGKRIYFGKQGLAHGVIQILAKLNSNNITLP